MKSYKKILTIGALAIGMMLIYGCASASADPGVQNENVREDVENTLIFADTQSPTSLDPAVAWNSWYTLRYGITETLYRLDDQLNPVPCLADSCEMKDETTWVITLKAGITFHNGRLLNAQAVKDSWERTAAINPRINEILYIDSITADDQTLTVKTTKPVPAFLNSLCEPLTAVIDVSALDNDEDVLTDPVGTGPFIPITYVQGKTLTVQRYDQYWGGTPKLSKAVFNVISDTQALSMAAQSGESHVTVSMPAASLELFQNDDSYYIDEAAGSRGQVIFMNFDNPYIKDPVIRQALSMIIDKESYANIINKGASVKANGLYPDFTDYGADDGQGYAYDPQGAKALLEHAGYTDSNGDGFVEKDGCGTNAAMRLVTYNTKAELPAFCEEMSASAAKIGLDLKVEIYESVTSVQQSGDFDLLLVSFTMMPTGDPQYFADIAFKTGGSSNYGHYSNPEVDRLIEQLDVTFDVGQRVTLAKEIQAKILEDAGFIVIGHSKYNYVMERQVSGVFANPSEYYLLTADTCIQSGEDGV